MLSRSCFNLLNLASEEDIPITRRIPRIMSIPGVLSDVDNSNSDSESVSSVVMERRIVVANQLPLKASRDLENDKWRFDWDRDALVLQLKDGFGPDIEVIYVGSLAVEFECSEQDEIAQFLMDRFRCVPTFLPLEIQNKFYHGFCKHYLWPLFHYMLPLSPNNDAQFEHSLWQAYLLANKTFSDKVMEVINPDEDYVWIHDYHLLAMPTFLRRSYHRIKIGFFLHSPFPSSEIYRSIPVRDEILRALLNSDLIGFHTFDYARHFLSCCSRMLGLDYESKRGYIGLEYYGRTVSIKILPVGIHMGELESLVSLPKTADMVRDLKERFHDKIVMLGVDDMDLFKGISFKLSAMKQLLEQNPDLRGKIVMVQIANPARSRGKDIQEVENETHEIARQVNEIYGKPGYEPIVFIHRHVPTQEKVAYYAISECCVVNAVRDGMNLVPYKYTVCRNSDFAPKQSVIIVSEFIGCSPSLSGAIRVNPWNIEAVSDAMSLALNMPESEKQLRHEKHYRYVSSHDVAYWARSFDQDLERSCREHFVKRCWGMGFGLNFRVVALGPNFRKLSLDHIIPPYRNTKSRLILLDYDGTMMPQVSVNKTPGPEVVSVVNDLCSDAKNTVFVVSGRGRESLSQWFSKSEKLGISAEHGYFTRWSRDSPWESGFSGAVGLEWKKMVEPIMEVYTETTDGSFIEHKESAMVWHHQEADPDFGSCQAKELLDHLENVLANEPVVVKRGQYIVEVKPQGVSKGWVVENVISRLQSKEKTPDMVLCIGDDRSDEDMFESIARSPCLKERMAKVFACTVGQKPSMAKYYLDDTVDVMKLLQGLAMASSSSSVVRQPGSAKFHATFESPV